VSICRNRSWEEIAHFQGDFLIIYFDLKEKTTFVISDQTGKFPCYFFVTNEDLVLSTSFYNIFKLLSSPKLNIGHALDFIYRDILITNKTIIEGVFLLPPATLGEFKNNGTHESKTLLDVEKFLSVPFKKYSNLEEFGNDFFKALNEVVKERLATLNRVDFCSDISSGFDSSLICYLLKKNSLKSFVGYSQIAKAAIQDTQPEIVSDFARKHNLRVKFVPYDHLFPFSTKEDLEWIRRGPSLIQKSQVYNLLHLMRKDGNLARFTGEGGDETYWSNDDILNLILRFPIQKHFFESLASRKYGIDKILTEKGIEILLDKERFRQKSLYPSFVSASAITLLINNFPLSWETEVWPITPFMDARLIQIARGIPSKGKEKRFLKQEIWKGRNDIFTKGQFREKGGTEEHYKRFLVEKREFVASILKNSLLGERGWAKSLKVINDISNGEMKAYCEGEVMGYLINLLELEYFIQQNNIKVSG